MSAIRILFAKLWRVRRFWLIPAVILILLFVALYILTANNDQEAFRYMVF